MILMNCKIGIDVRFENDTVWLTIEDMSLLFEKSRSTELLNGSFQDRHL